LGYVIRNTSIYLLTISFYKLKLSFVYTCPDLCIFFCDNTMSLCTLEHICGIMCNVMLIRAYIVPYIHYEMVVDVFLNYLLSK